MLKNYLTITEAATLKNVTRRTMLNHCQRGDIKADFICGRWLIEASELEKFAKQKRGLKHGQKINRNKK